MPNETELTPQALLAMTDQGPVAVSVTDPVQADPAPETQAEPEAPVAETVDVVITPEIEQVADVAPDTGPEPVAEAVISAPVDDGLPFDSIANNPPPVNEPVDLVEEVAATEGVEIVASVPVDDGKPFDSAPATPSVQESLANPAPTTAPKPAVEPTPVPLAPKTLGNSDASGASVNVTDIKFFGNGDLWQLLSKASSQHEGWMKSTKAMQIARLGCLIQVTTQQRNPDGSYACAEAVTFVPNVSIIPDANGGRKLTFGAAE